MLHQILQRPDPRPVRGQLLLQREDPRVHPSQFAEPPDLRVDMPVAGQQLLFFLLILFHPDLFFVNPLK